MIRSGTMNDVATVREIAHISWKDAYEGIIPSTIQTSFINKSYSNAMMEMRLKKTILLIAEQDGEPVGFANFTKVDDDGDAEVIAMYLKPAFQGNGLGRQLLQSGLSYLMDGSQLFVYVESQNHKGRCFYEANDFSLVEEFDEYFEGHPIQTAKYVYTIKAPAL